ncbi:HAD family hydrolase [Litorivita pollutaquae]|uniref:HAD family hydrolase n=1 Tax=Litorivita pollutaquae TaxID=2200892 RepID=A0A2V4MKH6_9RHOB|nr:HAD-IA family hydrolase [Litorivita pollutaquae]PYC47125.1 HAD family hydrolase [Litorivita pollutaquae]
MNGDLRLIIFDVDGTLVDSQGDIIAAMTRAFDRAGAPVPPRRAILSIVGLSLPEAFARLAPQIDAALRVQMVEWYKDAYVDLRSESGAAQSSPFYPHVREILDDLARVPENLLAVATGKSRRGLDKLLEGHGLTGFFINEQVSDFHPSKPHPSMLRAALSETGVDAGNAVMIGDTLYDMEMAAAAGIKGIGVSWGYHPRESLGAAQAIVDDFRALPETILTVLEA